MGKSFQDTTKLEHLRAAHRKLDAAADLLDEAWTHLMAAESSDHELVSDAFRVVAHLSSRILAAALAARYAPGSAAVRS